MALFEATVAAHRGLIRCYYFGGEFFTPSRLLCVYSCAAPPHNGTYYCYLIYFFVKPQHYIITYEIRIKTRDHSIMCASVIKYFYLSTENIFLKINYIFLDIFLPYLWPCLFLQQLFNFYPYFRFSRRSCSHQYYCSGCQPMPKETTNIFTSQPPIVTNLQSASTPLIIFKTNR